jgi:hypothetical protein
MWTHCTTYWIIIIIIKTKPDTRHNNIIKNFIIIIIIIIVQQAVQCVHIFLRPFINYVIFFLQLRLSFQCSSTNPFSPISPLIPSAQLSLGLPSFFLPGERHFITSIVNPPSSIL